MTLVEVALVLLVLAILSAMITSSIARFSTTQAYAEGQAKAADAADRIARAISEDATLALFLFGRTAMGADFMQHLDLSGLRPYTGNKLPAITSAGYFDRDPPGTALTGNLLFFARSISPVDVEFEVDDEEEHFIIDAMRIVLYAPCVVSPAGQPLRFDLCRWSSVAVIRLNNIEAIGDPVTRVALCAKLHDMGYRFAWEPGRDWASGMFEIGASGSLTPAAESSVRLPRSEENTRMRLLAGMRMELPRNASLMNVKIPAYAQATASSEFPMGFEVKIDGVSAGRMVLVRLVVAGGVAGTFKNSFEVVRVTNCRSDSG
jgi:hypothetical protein